MTQFESFEDTRSEILSDTVARTAAYKNYIRRNFVLTSDDPIICINPFVRRQTAESQFSHFDGSWADLVAEVHLHWVEHKPGYRDGVVLVPVKPKGFYSGIVTLEEGNKLGGIYAPRKPGEKPRKQTWAQNGKKIPAVFCEIVLYSSAVLAEDGNNHLSPEEGNWEIISINASPIDGKLPMKPETLIANHLYLDGGTKSKMTDSEFVIELRKSVEFWSNKDTVAPS